MSLFKEEADFIRQHLHLISERKATSFFYRYSKEFGCLPTSVTQAFIDVMGMPELLLSHQEWIFDNTFEDCVRLGSVTIPGNIKVIQIKAFANSDVEDVTFTRGVTTIWNNAFENCFKLNAVFISKTVTRIGKYCFHDCDRLSEIHYEGTIAEWKKIILDKDWKDSHHKVNLYCSDGGLII
jgi:hypothetical protein